MKSAIKILSVLGIIFIGLMFIVFLVLTVTMDSLIDWSFKVGSLYHNGALVTTESELEIVKGIFKVTFTIILVVVAMMSILPIISLVTANSDNNTLHLVLGILCCISTIFIIIGILQILMFVGVDGKSNNKTIEVSN